MTSDGEDSATSLSPEEDSTGVLDNVVPRISKTPLFEAIHAARYQRQALIREIQQKTDSKLICYVGGITAPVDREDVRFFVDLLHNISPGQNIDLLLHTVGGDIDAAEKLITMVRKRAGTSRLKLSSPGGAWNSTASPKPSIPPWRWWQTPRCSTTRCPKGSSYSWYRPCSRKSGSWIPRWWGAT